MCNNNKRLLRYEQKNSEMRFYNTSPSLFQLTRPLQGATRRSFFLLRKTFIKSIELYAYFTKSRLCILFVLHKFILSHLIKNFNTVSKKITS